MTLVKIMTTLYSEMGKKVIRLCHIVQLVTKVIRFSLIPPKFNNQTSVVVGKIRTEKLNFLNFTNYEKIKTNIYHIL